MIAQIPWYEFWRHGIWIHAQLTHLHAPWWAWLLRVDFVLGALFLVAFTALISSEGHDKPRGRRKPRAPKGSELSWFGIAVIISPALLVVAFMVWWGYPLLILGLMVPILSPFVLADLLVFRQEKRRIETDSAAPPPPSR
jgi:hypothetical protein